MQISENGKNLIKKFEGLRLSPYLCSAGKPTIGWGSTYYENGNEVTMKDPKITEARANQIFDKAVQVYVDGVNGLVKSKITQNQFDALVSFAYNLGIKALANSTLIRKVNLNPKDSTITAEFLKWVNAGGKRIEGLVTRRQTEATLYCKI